jgi:hypothetical protein
MKAVVAGWFSYESGHATGGDLLARDVLCDWLDELKIKYDIAVAPPFTDGLAMGELDPADYTHAFMVCGPFCRGALERHFLLRFSHCRIIGLNLSLDLAPSEWNPFDFLLERDSVEQVNADMVFASAKRLPPVVGVCLVEPHPEADTATAHAAIESLLHRHEAARVALDTRLDHNAVGLRTPGEIEALISCVDVVVTTRLHGLVMGLKRGVPVLAVDAVPGGGKISRQCRHIEWPYVFCLDQLSADALDQAFARMQTDAVREAARRCAAGAVQEVGTIRQRLVRALTPEGTAEQAFARRQSLSGMARFIASLPPESSPSPAENGVRARLRRLGLRLARGQGSFGT